MTDNYANPFGFNGIFYNKPLTAFFFLKDKNFLKGQSTGSEFVYILMYYWIILIDMLQKKMEL